MADVVIDLSTLTSDEGFIIQGDGAYDRLGTSVSSAGDQNGDGIDDLLVGASGANGGSNVGEAYVIYGVEGDSRGTLDVTDLSPDEGFIIDGTMVFDTVGGSVSAADINGDGIEDLIIGAIGAPGITYTGEIYVIYGTDDETRDNLELSALSPSDGFIIQGEASSDRAGTSVSYAGDVNGDGIDDLIIGADGNDNGGSAAGAAYVIYGVEGETRDTVELSALTASEGFIIQGDVADDNAGRSVSDAGDINGDGIDDLIVGAPSGDDGGNYAGEAYVIYGVAGDTRGTVDLTNLSDSDGFVIQGDAADDFVGRSVSSAGDVNGDGIDDLIVGAPYGDDGGNGAGEAYVIYGVEADSRDTVDLTDLSVSEGFVIQGDGAGDGAGRSVSSAGDVNGDGINDLIVGASRGNDGGNYAGQAYVIYGVEGDTRGTVDLTDLSASDGFVIQGDEANDRAGFSVSAAGDVNGDGIDDLIVGAAYGDDGGDFAGEAYVIYGFRNAPSATGLLAEQTVTAIDPSFLDLSGLVISDVDATGTMTVTLAATGGTLDAAAGGGVVASTSDGGATLTLVGTLDALNTYLAAGNNIRITTDPGVLGIAAASIELTVNDDDGAGDVAVGTTAINVVVDFAPVIDTSTLSPDQGFIIQGGIADDSAGFSVSAAGDVNGDGIDDMIVGAIGLASGGDYAGGAYVIYGETGSTREVLGLSALPTTDGYTIQGEAAGAVAGYSVSSAGDINGDGIDDLIVGAPYFDDTAAATGRAYVIYGQTGNPSTVDLASLQPSDGFVVQNTEVGLGVGYSVSSAGDVNNDGIDDLIVGAPGSDAGGGDSGEAFVVYGEEGNSRGAVDLTTLTSDEGFVIQGDLAGDYAGISVSSAGDVNGDGIDDLIVGAVGVDAGGSAAGAAYVIYGQDGSGRGPLDLSSLFPSDGFIIQGDMANDQAGTSVSSAGDVNGDGIDDMIVGATYGETDNGAAYVIYGQAGSSRGTIDLTNLSQEDGFAIIGDAVDDRAGFSVSSAGDVNGDGIADLIVGARGGDDAANLAGEAYVLYGQTGSDRGTVDLTGLSASDGFIIVGDAENDALGNSVSSAGDVNNDGLDDLIVGAVRGDDGGEDAGEAYVVYGFRNPPTASGLPASLDATEDELSPLDLSGLGILDVDPTGDMSITFAAGDGTLEADATPDVAVELTDGGQTLTLTGTLEALNAYLDTPGAMSYLGAPDANGLDGVSVTINDLDGAGDVAVGTIEIDIAPVDEEPEDPTDPVDPVDPVDPIDPGDPTEPEEPGDPTDTDQVIAEGGGGSDIQGGGGDDLLSAASGSNTIDGSGGDDVLASGFDDDSLFGGAGNDILLGDNSDFIAGSDLLDGGTGDDLMEGGGGADTFVFATGDGSDTIGAIALDYDDLGNSTVSGADFVSGVDTVALGGFGLTDGAEAYGLVSDVGGVATFSDQGTVITFAGLTTADLSADDFQIL